MSLPRLLTQTALLLSVALLLAGCERHFFKSEGVITSDGGALAAWSRPVQGCSPDPLDGLPPRQSSTLFTFYWDNPVERDVLHMKRILPPSNLLERLEVTRQPDGLRATMKTAKLPNDIVLNSANCTVLKATKVPGKPVIADGRPTVDGSLDLDCRAAGSHVTASVRFTGCEY